MAGSNLFKQERTAPDDLKLTAEIEGESFTCYISAKDLDSENFQASALADYFSCVLCCRKKTGFGACMVRCVETGKCCDSGATNCEDV